LGRKASGGLTGFDLVDVPALGHLLDRAAGLA